MFYPLQWFALEIQSKTLIFVPLIEFLKLI